MATVERPPGPGPEARGGYQRDPLAFLTELQRTFGDLVYFKVGLQPTYLVSDPDMIREVLVKYDDRVARGAGPNRGYAQLIGEGLLMTSEGERYRRQRRLVQPALHGRRVREYVPIMVETAEKIGSSFREGEARNIHQDMLDVTMGIVIRCLFGSDLPGETIREFGDAVDTILRSFDRAGSRYVAIDSDEVQAALGSCNTIVYDMIARRRREGVDRGDLLSMLLLSQDEEGDRTGLSDEEVRGEILSLIAAGHETTSSSLSWAWFLLSQHPEVEASMHSELDRVLGDRPPTIDDLATLTYLDGVVHESLRLFPPGGLGVDRIVRDDIELGKHTIPEGAIVVASQYVVQRDERWFPDPARFDPLRWREEERRTRPAFSYFPFSGGSRTCVGMGFAMTEIPIVLATLARRWRLEMERDAQVDVDVRVTMKPKSGLMMTPRRRS